MASEDSLWPVWVSNLQFDAGWESGYAPQTDCAAQGCRIDHRDSLGTKLFDGLQEIG